MVIIWNKNTPVKLKKIWFIQIYFIDLLLNNLLGIKCPLKFEDCSS